MKLSLFAVATMASLASAHYVFESIVIDGQDTKPWEYVLPNTRTAAFNPTKWKNLRDDMTPDMDDFRCNKGAFEAQKETGTAEVKAGVKMAAKTALGTPLGHPGPAFVYLSKAPGPVNEYKGDGDWFKIFEAGICNDKGDIRGDAWCTWEKDRIEFTIPQGTPDGEYLLRVEHVGVHGAAGGEAEFYTSCAQIRVTGGGSGVPGPLVKFPGAYKKDDPSWNFSIYGGFKPYPMPALAVWDGSNDAAIESISTDLTPATTSTTSTPQVSEIPATPQASEASTTASDPLKSSASVPSASATKVPQLSPPEEATPSASPVKTSPSPRPKACKARKFYRTHSRHF